MSEQLSSADLKQLLSALEELYQPTEAEQFGAHAVRVLERIFPNTIRTLDYLDLESGLIQSAVSREVAEPERLLPVIREHVTQNPLSRFVLSGGKAEVLDLRDHISRRAFQRTEFYQDGMRVMGCESQLMVPVEAPSLLGGMTVNRAWGVPFNAREKALCVALRPHLLGAFANARLLSSIRRRADASAGAVLELNAARLSAAGLTSREIEVLQWISEGKRDSEISLILGIALRTVHAHVRRILAKLGAETRTAAVRSARELAATPPFANGPTSRFQFPKGDRRADPARRPP